MDIKDVFSNATAQSMRQQSDATMTFLQLMDRVFLKLASEADTMQAVAARQLLNREAPIQNNTPAGGAGG